MEVYKLEESEDKATVLAGMGSPEATGRVVPGVRATKSSES